MTKEKIIEILEIAKDRNGDVPFEIAVKAISKMEIEALQKQDPKESKAEKPYLTEAGVKCKKQDCILRKDAIDAADKIIERDTSGNNDVVKAMTAWKSYIKALPSPQTEPELTELLVFCPKCGHTMSVIDKDTLVRCRDCKHRLSSLYCEAWNNSPGFPCIGDEMFCSMAERRTDGTEQP